MYLHTPNKTRTHTTSHPHIRHNTHSQATASVYLQICVNRWHATPISCSTPTSLTCYKRLSYSEIHRWLIKNSNTLEFLKTYNIVFHQKCLASKLIEVENYISCNILKYSILSIVFRESSLNINSNLIDYLKFIILFILTKVEIWLYYD